MGFTGQRPVQVDTLPINVPDMFITNLDMAGLTGRCPVQVMLR